MKVKVFLLVLISIFSTFVFVGCGANNGNETSVVYYATFIADGKEVDKVSFSVGESSIKEPKIPEKKYYQGSWENYTLGSSDITINAIYTPIKYTVTFMADGEQVGEILTYDIEKNNITQPAVPEKTDFLGSWEDYTLDGGNKIINAIYVENKKITITFVVNNKSYDVEFINGINQSDIPTIPTKEHYQGSWSSYTYTEDATVNAVYTLVDYCIHIDTTKMYDMNNQLTEEKYVNAKALGDVYYSSLTKWANLPTLEDSFEYKMNKTISYEYENFSYVVVNGENVITIKNGDDIDNTLFNGSMELTIYIKYGTRNTFIYG